MASKTWQDAGFMVSLSSRPLEELGLRLATYYKSNGANVTVDAVAMGTADERIAPADVLASVNGVRPKDHQHAARLILDSTNGCAACLFLRPGANRFGKPLLAIFGLMLACWVTYWLEAGSWRRIADPREL